MSAVAAFAVIRSARQNGRKRNTMDLILHQESDKELVEARAKFNALKAGAIKLKTYGEDANKNTEEAQTLRKILNLHELTAVAIQEGVIDECVYRRWFNSTFIKDFEAAEAYIATARKTYDNPEAFKELETMAKRWREDKAWPKRPNWFERKWRAFRLA